MAKFSFRLLLGIVLLAVLWLGLQTCLRSSETWREAAPGLETRAFTTKLGSRSASVTVARIDPARWMLRVVDRHQGQKGAGATAGKVCPSPGAAINASFFDESVAPLGLLVIDGKQRYPRHPVRGWPGGGGLFVVRKGKPSIIAHTAKVPAGSEYAVQCWPRLVIAGKIPKFKQRPAALRSAVGIDANGRVLFAASTNSLTFEEWAAFLHDDLGCREALNLDGGPSTQLAVRGKHDVTVPGGWPVPVLITAEKKKK
ncbi:MAG: phosphodiester glycosidase family protein [Armatimonadota bacterium]